MEHWEALRNHYLAFCLRCWTPVHPWSCNWSHSWWGSALCSGNPPLQLSFMLVTLHLFMEVF